MNSHSHPAELRTRELLAALEQHQVRFLILGGFAAQLHGATRQTKDLDLCPARDEDNLTRLADALSDLGARLRLPPELGDVEVLPSSRLLAEMTTTHWRTHAGDVDVLNAIAGNDGRPMDFAELAARAVTIHLGNVTLLIAGLGDIIAAKERANRPKDHAVLPELRAIHARNTYHRPPAPSPPFQQPSASSRPCAAPGPPAPQQPGRSPTLRP
jgi:hypothetical protein